MRHLGKLWFYDGSYYAVTEENDAIIFLKTDDEVFETFHRVNTNENACKEFIRACKEFIRDAK